MFRNFKLVSRMVFGRGCFSQLSDILIEKRTTGDGFMVFLLDDVFSSHPLQQKVPLNDRDQMILVNVE